MTCILKYIWILLAFIANVLIPVKVQFPMPMFPAPPPAIVPMPVPVAMCPMFISSNGGNNMHQSKTTTTTTTTKTPETIGIAIPMPMPVPMPMPMPIGVPAMPIGVPAVPPPNAYQKPPPRPNNCPPCPPCVCSPSCTPPAFSYCSPCHLKCRCRRKEDVPEPLPNRPPQGPAYGIPVPMPVMPPPVVVVPYPPPIPLPIRKPRKEQKYKHSSCSDESTETSSSESGYQRKRRYKRRKRPVYRRSLRSSESENELVKPMLSYVAKNGDIKFKTKISGDDVAELLGEKKDFQRHDHLADPVLAHEDEINGPNAIVITNNDKKQKRERYKKVLLREGVSNHVLGSGKKELVFRPSGDKKISNLTVSFQIS